MRYVVLKSENCIWLKLIRNLLKKIGSIRFNLEPKLEKKDTKQAKAINQMYILFESCKTIF